MGHRRVACVLCLLSVLVPAARADHLPEGLYAAGRPETRLAGISITRDGEVSKVIETYGPPTEKSVAPNNPGWIGYRWVLKDVTLEVSASNGIVTDVYVEGTGRGRAGRTGAGLRLGDSVKRLRAIYGQKHLARTHPDVRIGDRIRRRSERLAHSGVWERRRVTIEWQELDYTLTAGLDDRGKIVSLWLLRPECFPGECDE